MLVRSRKSVEKSVPIGVAGARNRPLRPCKLREVEEIFGEGYKGCGICSLYSVYCQRIYFGTLARRGHISPASAFVLIMMIIVPPWFIN